MDNQIQNCVTTYSIPTEHEMMVFQTMAKQAVDSKLYGRLDMAGVMTIMLAARELSIPVMQALNGGLNIIQGKIEISARMMSALIRKHGHSISIKESTDTSCTLVGRRKDTGDTATTSYTLEEAKNAGLVKQGGGWVKNPKDMCFARAMSRLARQLFSDCIGIGYVEGEIRATEAEIVVPEDLPREVVIEDDQKLYNDYMCLFPQEDAELANKYLESAMAHFGWTKAKTLTEFLKDTLHLREKFNVWKSRRTGVVK